MKENNKQYTLEQLMQINAILENELDGIRQLNSIQKKNYNDTIVSLQKENSTIKYKYEQKELELQKILNSKRLQYANKISHFLNKLKVFNKKMKPKIALIVDVEGWAFDNIAKQIKRNLSDEFDITIFYSELINNNIIKLFYSLKNFDLIHFMWRGHLSLIDTNVSKKYLENFQISYDVFYEYMIKDKIITTGVYDHMYIDEHQLDTTKQILSFVKGYTVSSKKLYSIYKNNKEISKPDMIITDGVDLDLFKMYNKKKFEDINNKKIVIGWVGNSKWFSEGTDLKGINTILKPVLNELIEEGVSIEIKFADKQDKVIPHSKMPEYYNQIDLYICTSRFEGTPNPVLEAIASGIPVISTDVGIVNQVFGKKQKQFILKERTKSCLKEKIIYLLENNNLFDELSKENLESIKTWDWKMKCEDFRVFFKKHLKNK